MTKDQINKLEISNQKANEAAEQFLKIIKEKNLTFAEADGAMQKCKVLIEQSTIC